MLNLINAKLVLKEKLEREFDAREVADILELVDTITDLTVETKVVREIMAKVGK